MSGYVSRRQFMRGLAAAGTLELMGVRATSAAAEPPPETRRLRLTEAEMWGGICVAPQYAAEELLRGEGFSEIQIVRKKTIDERIHAVGTGEADMLIAFGSSLITRIDAGDAIVMLAGAHVGCFELFASEQVRTIRDMKGKTVAINALGSPDHLFLSAVLVHVGLDPGKDIRWLFHPVAEALELFAAGKVDAFLNFPPAPQELRARKVGRVLLNSTRDRPWSQYFCCMLAANRDFVRHYPVATKRAVRGFIKSAEMCALEPERIARFLVDKKYTVSYDYALQALRDLPYARWREYNAEDAVRFYALRLHEAGLIKSSPQKIIAQGTDLRFLNELKKELKA